MAEDGSALPTMGHHKQTARAKDSFKIAKDNNSFKCCLHVLLLPVLMVPRFTQSPQIHPMVGDWMFKHMSLCETFCTPCITELMGTLTPCSFLWKLEAPERELRLCDTSYIPSAFSLSHFTLISGPRSPLDSPVKLLQLAPFSAVSWVCTGKLDSAH